MTDASSMHAGICCIAIDSPPAQHAAARQVGAGDGGHAGVFAGRCTAHRSPLRTLGAMNAEEPGRSLAGWTCWTTGCWAMCLCSQARASGERRRERGIGRAARATELAAAACRRRRRRPLPGQRMCARDHQLCLPVPDPVLLRTSCGPNHAGSARRCAAAGAACGSAAPGCGASCASFHFGASIASWQL